MDGGAYAQNRQATSGQAGWGSMISTADAGYATLHWSRGLKRRQRSPPMLSRPKPGPPAHSEKSTESSRDPISVRVDSAASAVSATSLGSRRAARGICATGRQEEREGAE